MTDLDGLANSLYRLILTTTSGPRSPAEDRIVNGMSLANELFFLRVHLCCIALRWSRLPGWACQGTEVMHRLLKEVIQAIYRHDPEGAEETLEHRMGWYFDGIDPSWDGHPSKIRNHYGRAFSILFKREGDSMLVNIAEQEIELTCDALAEFMAQHQPA